MDNEKQYTIAIEQMDLIQKVQQHKLWDEIIRLRGIISLLETNIRNIHYNITPIKFEYNGKKVSIEQWFKKIKDNKR